MCVIIIVILYYYYYIVSKLINLKVKENVYCTARCRYNIISKCQTKYSLLTPEFYFPNLLNWVNYVITHLIFVPQQKDARKNRQMLCRAPPRKIKEKFKNKLSLSFIYLAYDYGKQCRQYDIFLKVTY